MLAQRRKRTSQRSSRGNEALIFIPHSAFRIRHSTFPPGLRRVGLLDAHEDEVVEDAFGRQREVHDLGEVHLEDGQEEFHGRAADVEVFHRRDADDGGGIDGVLPVRDGGDVEDGIRLGQGVVAGVVAERAFVAQRFGGVNVAFDDEVGVGGDFEVVGLALDEFDGFFAEVTGEEEFVEAVGQRRGGDSTLLPLRVSTFETRP